MIEINLLPPELRAAVKENKFELNKLLYLIPVLFIVLILMHIILGINSIFLSYQYQRLNNEWNKLQPQQKQVEELKKEYNIFSQDITAIGQLAKGRVNWAEKLNLLSLKLPSGVWFNELLVSNKEFILRGSVISLEKQELSLINKFLANLKNDNSFIGSFIKLDLGPVKKNNIGGCDVLDFSLEGVLK